MADTRGRRSVGGFLGDVFQPSGERVAGQPVMIRMQGVPTMPGYRDRPGKWNVIIPPLLIAVRLIAEWLKHWKA